MKTALELAIDLFAQWQDLQALAPVRNQWRVYYTADNNIMQCALGPDWPSTVQSWLKITAEQAKNITQYHIVDHKLEKILDFTRQKIVQLHEHPQGEYFADEQNMSLLLEQEEQTHAFIRYSISRHS